MLVEFEVYCDGGWWGASGSEASIYTQGRTLDELIENIREAVSLHYEDDERVATGEQITVRFPVEFRVYPVALPLVTGDPDKD